jgi:hypothetical protein
MNISTWVDKISSQLEIPEQLPSPFPRHGIEGDCRPTEVIREVAINEVRASPGLEVQLVHLFLSRLQGDEGTMVLEPVLNVIFLTVFPHQFRDGMTALRNPLAFGQLCPYQDIECLIH